MSDYNIIGDFWEFVKRNKKWYLLPLFILLLAIGMFIAASLNPAVAPFIYTIF